MSVDTLSRDNVLQTQIHGAICVLRPSVPLQRDEVDLVADAARQAIANRVLVVVDLSGVTLIDGRGLDWLLDMDDQVAARGGCVRLCNAGDLCRDLLRITGVGSRLLTCDSLDAALADLAL